MSYTTFALLHVITAACAVGLVLFYIVQTRR